MKKTLYDLLNSNINYEIEYDKLRKSFFSDKLIRLNTIFVFSYSEIFNSWIKYWDYRGLNCDSKEIVSKIDSQKGRGNREYIKKCIYMCEFILNVRQFLKYIQESNEYSGGRPFDYFDDALFIDNVLYILDKLGYDYKVVEKYKVVLYLKNSDAVETAIVINNKEVSDAIIEYNDFRITNNVIEKRKILLEIYKYLEPNRKKISDKNKEVSESLFMAFNKLNIRHDNVDGKRKESIIADMESEELIFWYDNIYNLSLIAIRLIELDETLKQFKELKSKLKK